VDYDDFCDAVEYYDGKIGLVLNSDDEVTEVYIIASSGDDEVEGYFYSIDEERIRLEDSDGDKTYYYFKGYEDEEDDIYENVEFFDDDEDEVDFDDFCDLVDDYDGEILLILNNDEEVIEVYLMDAPDTDFDVEGYFYSMNDERIRLTETDDDDDDDYETYYYDDDDESKVDFYDNDGDKISFNSFKNKVEDYDEIGLVLNNSDEVIEVHLLEGNSSNSSTETVSGEANFIGTSFVRLNSRIYNVSNASSIDVKVADGDFEIDSYSELASAYGSEHKDFNITIEYDENKNIKEVTGYILALKEGDLKDVSTRSNGSIKVKCGSEEYTYQLASNCDFDNGDTRSYDDDLEGLYEVFDHENDVEVDLEFNSSGKVTKIKLDY